MANMGGGRCRGGREKWVNVSGGFKDTLYGYGIRDGCFNIHQPSNPSNTLPVGSSNIWIVRDVQLTTMVGTYSPFRKGSMGLDMMQSKKRVSALSTKISL